MAGSDFSVRTQSTDLDNLVRALRAESDGKQLRKELAKNMRESLKPAAQEAKNAIMAMSSSGTGSAQPGLRSEIAKKIRPEVRLTGRTTGARVKVRKTPNLRNFANAPKRTQQASWRAQTFGNGVWREQKGQLGWFDHSMHSKVPEYKAAVVEAMEEMAHRIVNRIHI